MLAGLPQDPRLSAAPVAPRHPWPKVAGAFAAGAACVLFINLWLPGDGKSPQAEPTRLSQRVQPADAVPRVQSAGGGTEQANVSAVAPVATEPPSRPQPPAALAEARAPDPAQAAPPAPEAEPKQAADPACEQQTWPYVNHACTAQEANGPRATRPVRVITTDRTAPSTVVTALPPPLAPRSTDGRASPMARAADPAHRTTDGSSGQAGIASSQASADARASAQADVPMPRPKPEAFARTVAFPADSPDRNETASQVPAALRESRSVRGVPEQRTEQRQAESDQRRAQRGAARRGGSDARGVREDGREVRHRAADDDEGYTLVRSYRLRDGRRLSVYQRPVEEERAPAREERPGFFPFSFNPAAAGN